MPEFLQIDMFFHASFTSPVACVSHPHPTRCLCLTDNRMHRMQGLKNVCETQTLGFVPQTRWSVPQTRCLRLTDKPVVCVSQTTVCTVCKASRMFVRHKHWDLCLKPVVCVSQTTVCTRMQGLNIVCETQTMGVRGEVKITVGLATYCHLSPPAHRRNNSNFIALVDSIPGEGVLVIYGNHVRFKLFQRWVPLLQ